ncbi:MAG TPA: FtsX-like permease family protein [Phycisphaerae bacterium]|nr:FtsX-like permease family protein [Phycisphaerae bacterium]
MRSLPLANLLHHKVGSAFSAMGIGIGVCMMVTLGGLSRGIVYEIADRWEGVDADLIVYPRKVGESVTMLTGAGISDRYEEVLPQKYPGKITRITPVFLWQMRLAGQSQMVAGITNKDMDVITGGAKAVAGKNSFSPTIPWQQLMDRTEKSQRLAYVRIHGNEDDFVFDPQPHDLRKAGWLEMIIDERLASAGNYAPGDTVEAAGATWTIAGIVPAGVLSRVIIPRRTAQYLFGGSVEQSTILFIKLVSDEPPGPVARQLADDLQQQVVPLAAYREMLLKQFGVFFVYVDAVNTVAIIIAVLFIMVVLYTMVLQRSREIAILKSFGSTNRFIVTQVLTEAMILTVTGAIIGISLALLSGWLIGKFMPLMTVSITPQWMAAGLAAAVFGALISAIYPAWRATRVDMLGALTYE